MVAAEAVAGARRATAIIDPAASQPAAWRTPPLRREEVRRFIRDPRADDCDDDPEDRGRPSGKWIVPDEISTRPVPMAMANRTEPHRFQMMDGGTGDKRHRQ